MVRTSSLKELWLTAATGRLIPWEQARALALRDVYRELHDGRNLSDEVSAHFHPCVDRCTTYQAILRRKVICGVRTILLAYALPGHNPICFSSEMEAYETTAWHMRNRREPRAEPSKIP